MTGSLKDLKVQHHTEFFMEKLLSSLIKSFLGEPCRASLVEVQGESKGHWEERVTASQRMLYPMRVSLISCSWMGGRVRITRTLSFGLPP
jgi:hypothetical protein